MAKYFITRHAGAVEWQSRIGLNAIIIEHFNVSVVKPGDLVHGNLPVEMAAEVIARGGRYFNLDMKVPREKRGNDHSAGEMQTYGAKLTEYSVVRLGGRN